MPRRSPLEEGIWRQWTRRHEEGQYRVDTERTRARARCRPLMTTGRPRRWLVVVAREEDEIHAKLRRVLAADRHLRVIFDRRASGWSSRSCPVVTPARAEDRLVVDPLIGKQRAGTFSR